MKPVKFIQEKHHGDVPNTICILGLGPSLAEYIDLSKRLGGKKPLADEVWGINAVGDIISCDRIFHMDDVRIQEIRVAEKPESNIAVMLEWIKISKARVYTSRPHDDYPAMVGYPIQAVLNTCRFAYFNSTAAWAVAYAIHIGVKAIRLYGCDFTYQNAIDAEKGRGCVEFWIGFAAARGVTISLPRSTSLMDAYCKQEERLYGYDTLNVSIKKRPSGKVSVSFTEREKLPTAQEIEANYDHKAHPNKLVTS